MVMGRPRQVPSMTCVWHRDSYWVISRSQSVCEQVQREEIPGQQNQDREDSDTRARDFGVQTTTPEHNDSLQDKCS